jgi:CRP-like cAMP-binding protein
VIVDLLKGCDLFAGLTPAELESVAALAHDETFERGKIILREGDPVSKFALVRAGVVEIGRRSSRNGGRHGVRRLERGDVFGELALFEEIPSTVEAVASVTPETKLATWHLFDVQRLLAANPATAYKIARNLLRKLRGQLQAMNAVITAISDELG